MNWIRGVALGLVVAGAAAARDVGLSWDYQADQRAGVEFEVFLTPADRLEWGEPVWRGATLGASLSGLDPRVSYRVAVRAARGKVRSGLSNILVFTPGEEPEVIEVPTPPREIRLVW